MIVLWLLYSIPLFLIPFQLVRFPTPFRKDMKALKAKRKKYKPEATPSTTIFRKGSVSSKDDLLVSVNAEVSSPPEDTAAADLKKSQDSLGDFRDVSSGRDLRGC